VRKEKTASKNWVNGPQFVNIRVPHYRYLITGTSLQVPHM